MYDLIIIGSGPAGLSAAVYAKRAGLNMLIIEKNPVSGGQIIDTYEVDNYLGIPGVNGFDLAMKFREHADKLGAEFADGTVTGIEKVSDNAKGESVEMDVTKVMSEKELVESEGFHYLRLPCQDHSWPYEEAVDRFISFVQSIDTDQVWLHFHCHAGKSRTAIFMAIYDMIKNPEVAFEDIMLRHAMTGSNYLPYADPESEIAEVYALRAKRIRQVYDYLHETDVDYTIPWSEWVAGM